MWRFPDRADLACLLVVLGEPILRKILGPALSHRSITFQVVVGLVVPWLATLSVLALILGHARRPPADLGLCRPVPLDLVYGIGGFVFSTVGIMLTFPLIDALGLDTLETGVRRLAVLPLALRLVIPPSAGITEEILFRGFLIECLRRMLGHLGVASVASWLIFTALHVPFWGIGGALQISVASGAFCLVYALRRSVVPCIVVHVLNDAWAFLIVPLLIPEFP